MKKKILLMFMVILLIVSVGAVAFATSRRGSSGKEVRQIQEKLKRWGYYTGSVDGIYGSKTEQAVEKFQRSNGLTADGIAGKATLAAMGITSSSGSGSSGGSSESQNAKQNFEAQAPIAVFVKGKMVGKLEDEESDGFLLANPNSKVSNLELNEIECNCNMDKTQMKISVQIKSKNNSAKIRFENEIPCLDLFVDIKNAEIKEVISSDIHSVFTTEEYIAIKQTIKEKVSELIGKCFEKAQTLNADVFKAYEIAYKYHYDTLMKYYDTPEEFVKNLKLNVDVRTQQLEY